ncbi:hypothetical protein RchiOBHm_Chr6g0259361 [Rosa chinensis]|uniref:Uncharacterized protein n=1 Tax=Rosa chinensis TaxID=74649 RepID=A0A2P6PMU2_ROSCH|nr:hypothetical protein RchiOBHm_Chr6g0259361 [Rosa chinensis]
MQVTEENLLCMELHRCMFRKLALLITLYHNLQTHLNLIKDLGGSLDLHTIYKTLPFLLFYFFLFNLFDLHLCICTYQSSNVKGLELS